MSRHDKKVKCPTCGKPVFPRGLGGHMRSHMVHGLRIDTMDKVVNAEVEAKTENQQPTEAQLLRNFLQRILEDLRLVQYRSADRIVSLAIDSVTSDIQLMLQGGQ